MENKITHINGDAGFYTGTSEIIHGGTFFHVMMVEGRFVGQIKVTSRAPGEESPFVALARNDWKTAQAGFARLNKS
jgi:hypothetical protein